MRKPSMTRSEKDLISKLSAMINYSEYIHANLVVMERVCGNKNCRCIKEGKKHKSLYLVTMKKDGARKMIFIPKKLEEKTRAYVLRYFKIKEAIEKISDINLERLLDKGNV
ncbi:MAG: hypothetical protein M1409_06995 [Actinobacteria bacterium]|nr:hypothetical protein [Actinomycetota bacterium]